MNALVIALAACALAQPDSPPDPNDRTVYEITQQGKQEPIYGFMNLDDWNTKSSIKVELDAPWEPEPRYEVVFPSKATWTREWSGGHETRLADQARAAGFERIGSKYYPIKEVAWARKAREMAGIDENEPETATLAAPSEPAQDGAEVVVPSAAPPVPGDGPGLVSRWGGQILLGAIAAVLVILVAKTLVFSGNG